MCELWDLIPNPGIAKAHFETLGKAMPTRPDAVDLSDRLLPLVLESIRNRNGRAPKTVFVSYSRHDAVWLHAIRTILRPVERAGWVRCWTDVDIEAGSQWEEELRRKMSVCDVAILLVSSHFLQSAYVKNVELPVLLERARAGRTRLLWVLLSPCSWTNTDLVRTQAALNPRVSLAELQPTELQINMVRLRQMVETCVRPFDGSNEELEVTLANIGSEPSARE
jgi:hypothetical protein